MSTGISMIDYPTPLDSNGNELVSLGSVISGEDTENNRLMTYELWDYGDDNVGPTSAVVKAAPGVLGVVQVIVADATETVTFYDSATETTTEKVVLGIVDIATAGTQIKFGRPFAEGLYAVFSEGTDTGVVAVGRL